MNWLQYLHTTDLWLFHWCGARRFASIFIRLSRTISKSADGGVYLLFLVGFGAVAQQQAIPFIKAILLAFILERCIYFVLKNSFKRNRPADSISGFESVIVPSDQFSFPSGHTSAAFLFAVFLSYLFPLASPLFFFWASSVALSRVFLGVHFPFDTVIGALLGSSIALFVITQGNLL
jgi:undecaprenyl-diphosphatase